MNKFLNPAKRRPDGPTRSNTGVSIKKETISAPIPQVEDDEFPIRTPGASIATPLGTDSMEKPVRYTEPPPVLEPVQNGPVEVAAPSDSVRTTKTPSTTSEITVKEAAVPQPQSEQPVVMRTSTGSVRSRTSLRKPERKKSSLRSVLGKLFGRKRKSSTSTSRKRESRDMRGPQHRSDPTALNRSPLTKINPPKRSASLPINEFNRALRSHSVVIEDFPLRDSFQQTAPAVVEGRPRGATTPSRAWEHGRIPGYADWTGLTPRPASSHARGSRTDSDVEAREVGVALTSGNKAENRKSRSVGDLREAISNTLTRRRSDEIRYWRQSHDQGLLSPLSSTKPDIDEEPLVVEPSESNKENYQPPQPFNFGPMGEMAGMKITQAASLESRVLQLEQRMHQVERAVTRIAYTPVTEPMQFHDAERRSMRPTTGDSELSLPQTKLHRASPQCLVRPGQVSQFNASSYGGSRPSTTNTNHNASTKPSFENPPTMFSTFHKNPPRPLSTSTTIRNPLSSSPTSKENTLTAEHFAALQTLIQHEQSTRQTLEDMVQNLQQEVINLRNSIAHHPAFNTFENDSDSEDELRFAEDFHTPSQEPPRGFGDEIFGDVSGNRGAGFVRGGGTAAAATAHLNHKKSTSRTMSLSQLTQNGIRQHPVGTVI